VPDDSAAVIPSSRPDPPIERGQALTGASYSNEIHVSHIREGGIGPEVIRAVSIRSQAITHRSAGEHSRLEYHPRTPAPGDISNRRLWPDQRRAIPPPLDRRLEHRATTRTLARLRTPPTCGLKPARTVRRWAAAAPGRPKNDAEVARLSSVSRTTSPGLSTRFLFIRAPELPSYGRNAERSNSVGPRSSTRPPGERVVQVPPSEALGTSRSVPLRPPRMRSWGAVGHPLAHPALCASTRLSESMVSCQNSW